ncbi:MAG: FAD-dependent oxidoreductase [Bacillota bacterium]
MREKIAVNQDVVIIGGGISGMETAAALRRLGHRVFLVEKSDQLGGVFAELASLVETREKPAEIVEKLKKQLLDDSDVTVFLQSQVVDCFGVAGNFRVLISGPQGQQAINAGSVVIAIGLQTVLCPAKYGGLGMNDRVLGLLGLEKALKQTEVNGQTYVFILGKTTENFYMPYISTLKNALLLRETYHKDVHVFTKNMKVAQEGLEELFGRARAAGVNFYRYEKDVQIIKQGDKIEVAYQDPFLQTTGNSFKVAADWLIIPEEIVPNEDARVLGQIFRIRLDAYDFRGEDNVHIGPQFTSREGIYVVGNTHAPSNYQAILMDAALVAGEIQQKLPAAEVEVIANYPRVEAAKCVVCLTCYRCCPHGAIEIKHDYASYNNLYGSVAYMNPIACRRCGICAAECPGKAITMPGYEDQEILGQLKEAVN